MESLCRTRIMHKFKVFTGFGIKLSNLYNEDECLMDDLCVQLEAKGFLLQPSDVAADGTLKTPRVVDRRRVSRVVHGEDPQGILMYILLLEGTQVELCSTDKLPDLGVLERFHSPDSCDFFCCS